MRALQTVRLVIVPATAELVRKELEDPAVLFELLRVPEVRGWPPPALREALPLFLERLEADEGAVGWFSWYWIRRENRCLVGGGGVCGPPSADGSVEVGYETRAAYRRRHIASEAVGALVRGALAVSCVQRIRAEAEPGNVASAKLLHRAGFVPTGARAEKAVTRWELEAPRQPTRVANAGRLPADD